MRNRIRIQDKDKNNTGEYVKLERREDTDRDRLEAADCKCSKHTNKQIYLYNNCILYVLFNKQEDKYKIFLLYKK